MGEKGLPKYDICEAVGVSREWSFYVYPCHYDRSLLDVLLAKPAPTIAKSPPAKANTFELWVHTFPKKW